MAKMNRRGGIFLGVIIGLMIFFAGMLALPYIKDVNSSNRTDLNCDSGSSISDGNKLTCLINDTGVPLFVICFLSVAGGVVTKWLT